MLDRVELLTLKDARDKAATLLRDIRSGKDPRAERRSAAELTLRSMLESYLVTRHKLRASTVTVYRRTVTNHMGDWLDMLLTSISAAMVEERHRKIAREVARPAASLRLYKDVLRHQGGVLIGVTRSPQYLWGYRFAKPLRVHAFLGS